MSEPTQAERAAALVTEIETLGSLVDALPLPAEAPPAIAEDMAVVRTQAKNAVASIALLKGLIDRGSCGEIDTLLHRLNNYFTGIASLATLCRDDVRGAPALTAQLVEVEAQARRAADRVRELARAAPR